MPWRDDERARGHGLRLTGASGGGTGGGGAGQANTCNQTICMRMATWNMLRGRAGTEGAPNYSKVRIVDAKYAPRER